LAVVSAALPWAVDARTASLLRNTLLLCAATCGISLPAGALLAWLVVRTDLPGRRACVLLFAVMLFVPLYLQTAAWQSGFGLQGWFTLSGGGPVLLEGWRGAIWVHAMAALPWVVLIVGAGLWLVEPELEEQALLDGSPRQVLFRVTLPAAFGAIVVAALWVTIMAAGEMSVTDLFGVRTYAEEVYTREAVGPQPGDPPLGFLPGALLTVWLVVAGLGLTEMLTPRNRPIPLRRRVVFRLRRWRIPAALLIAVALLFVVGVPLASLCYKAGILVTQTETGRERVWSIAKCLQMVVESPWRYRREVGWSFLLGTLTATTCVILATGLGWIARRGGLRALGVLVATAVCLAVPGPIVGLGVIRLLNRPEVPLLVNLYDQPIPGPWLALCIRSLPPATFIMWHALRSVPREVLDAAAVDGAGSLAQLWRIALPCRLWALGLAWVASLAVALGDLAASILAAPPGVSTLSIQISILLHYGVEERVAGICLAQVVFFTAIAACAAWLAGRWQRAGGTHV
jgi:iron(III) transport system permease protein